MPDILGLHGPVPKSFRAGTHRLIAPAETVGRVSRFLPVFGITRVANVTGLDSVGIPVVMVCRPNSRSLAVAQGKGVDLAAAKASGLMESVEAYHAERISLPLKLGSYEDLRYTHRVADVTALPSTAGSRFHPSLPLLWIAGHDLLRDEPAWVPYEMVHTNYTLPLPTGSGCFAATSNGLASGNHLLEAISYGLCELVERDSTTLWHMLDEAAQSKTRIDLNTVDNPDCCQVLEKYERAGVGVAVWEATSDVGIPSFLCLVVERTEDPLRLLYAARGMGCHPARRIALLRALTEAAQSRLTLIAGSRDDLFRASYERSRSPDVLASYRALLEPPPLMRDFRHVPTSDAETFDEDVAWELERLRTVGITEAVAVDLTKPEFRLPVVRLVIPGLEGNIQMPDYVPGARARRAVEGAP